MNARDTGDKLVDFDWLEERGHGTRRHLREEIKAGRYVKPAGYWGKNEKVVFWLSDVLEWERQELARAPDRPSRHKNFGASR